MAIILHTDGTQTEIKGSGPDGTLTLEQLQKAVGGYIESLQSKGKVVFLNEEGKSLGLPLNIQAFHLLSLREGDYIVGDVVVCDLSEVD